MDKGKKIKVVQLAKDLRTDAQKIADEMVKMGHNVKKTGSLTEAEANMIISKFTKDNQSEDFNDFFSNTLTKDTDKRPEPEKEKKTARNIKKEKSTSKSDEKAEEKNVKKTNEKNNGSQKNRTNNQAADKNRNQKPKKKSEKRQCIFKK